ncbi:unnamed protein product [Haemonchus placei]|uniref:MICOS complex subunit MIC60 n=1 Tax=Haemonchus placei TaxID=6290 RepID=A0A0N4WY70_HAEPC|nr:unnamed protein product [Haemonchus placei]
MLRAVKNKYVGWGLKGIRAQSAQAAPTPPRKPSSATSKFLYSVGALATVAVGVIGYAYVDPEFKKKVETTVPQVKPYFDAWFGSSHNANVGQLLSDLKDKVAHAIPVVKKEKNVEGVREREPPVQEAGDARAPMETGNVKIPIEFESSLLSAIHSAEDKVRAATDAKIRTIAAINEHASLVKETVDESQNADWGKVTTALQQAESLASRDGKAEADGRNYIDYLRTIISRGRSDPVTASNPLLLNATETANKLSHQLDELHGLVLKARQESSISNQYKDLVQRSREQFAQEVKNILPNVDINVKNKSMEPEELNALIAHAHLKVDNLRRQLLEQQDGKSDDFNARPDFLVEQVREEQHIARAIADQREADERIAAERLENELQRIQQQQDVEIERAVLQKRSLWQNELEEQLRRSAAAHSEHLEQIIRTQRQLFEIEHNQKIEEACCSIKYFILYCLHFYNVIMDFLQASRLERDRHSREVGVALSRLAGIESALDSRVALDMENRRAKQFWIACHNLIGSIKHGNKSGEDMDKRRFPLNESLSFFKQVPFYFFVVSQNVCSGQNRNVQTPKTVS